MSNNINKPININNTVAKNRILMPAMVCFNWADSDGLEIISRSEHYGKRAKGGTGLIIIEASSICKEGQIHDSCIGIWNDNHIPQFKNSKKLPC